MFIEDPKAFIIDFIRKLQASKAAKVDYPCLFNDTNVRSLFGIMDPANKGYISHSQYKAGEFRFLVCPRLQQVLKIHYEKACF